MKLKHVFIAPELSKYSSQLLPLFSSSITNNKHGYLIIFITSLRSGARYCPLICCCSRGPLCSLAKSSRTSPSQLNTQQTTGFSSRQILSGRLSNHFHRLLAFIRSLSPVHLWPLASTSASSHEGSQPSPSQLNSTHQQTSDHDNYRLEGCLIIIVVFSQKRADKVSELLSPHQNIKAITSISSSYTSVFFLTTSLFQFEANTTT
ncbi:DNA polymerase zeta catalytic subunit [Fusarium oxysporum f. sp. albedinis]|nr:DNA polymerase zeta catalytic subunit [Fusarium oxysporum f. sp. albedinis]